MTTTSTPAEGLVDSRAVARALGFTDRHVRRLAAQGRIPAVRLGLEWRFDPDEVAAAIFNTRTSEETHP